MSKYPSKIIAVNNPGGQPRQFCVQFRDSRCNLWKRSAVFLEQDAAERCSRELEGRGVEARVVHYHLPTAA